MRWALRNPMGEALESGAEDVNVDALSALWLEKKRFDNAELYGSYPCHRVVNHAGRPAPNWPEQQHLLEREGIQFKPNGCVDMKRFRWEC